MNDPGGGLKSAAASAQPSSSAQASEFAISSGAGSLMSSAMDTFIEHVSVVETVLRIQLTIEEMTQLAQWLQKFPGRKNVLWASAAFPLGVDPNFSNQVNTDIPGETSEIYMKMINMFAESRVSIYPIDPRGMQTDTSFNAESIAQLNQISAARTISRQFYVNEATEHATMQAIASDTGGLPVYNRNNLTQAVSDAIDDGRSYYTISYTPSEKKTGGEWRSVRVQFADPLAYKGAQILCRKGYYADNLKVPAHKTGTAFVKLDPNSPAAESHPYSKSAMLHGAPFPQDIPFTTRVLPASQSVEQTIAPDNQGPPNHKMKPPFHRYDVDAAAAARYFNLIQGPDGHYMGSVQMAVMAYDSDGRLLNTASRTLSFDLTPHEYEQFQRLGYREHLEISTPAKGVTFLRIGIEERTTGRVGAVEIASSAVNELAPPDYASKLPSLRSR
jgi:VWFA-related protein